MSENEQTVVLVADDEPSTLALVTAHVRSKGFKVIEASDGDMAWQLAHQHLPHLVILDVMMPGMSGWEVCRKIRESLPLAHTGVIMLTGIGENLNEMTSPLYGADAHVDKPFEFSELDEKIQETLAARKEGAYGRSDGGDEEQDDDEDEDLDDEIEEVLPKHAMQDDEEDEEEDDDVDFAEDERELPLDSLPPPAPKSKAMKKAAASPLAALAKQETTAKKASKKTAGKKPAKVAKAAKKASKKTAKVAKKTAGKKPAKVAKAAKKASKKTAKAAKKVSKKPAKKAKKR